MRTLVMELVEGEDLSALIAHGAIPLADALPLAKQIAGALEAAHDQGIVHRDLKPANIRVRADGTVKVLDFGLAKAIDPAGGSSADPTYSPTFTSPAMTQAGMILGTAAYMAPEQARGRAVDRRADIWAFGSIFYEMVTGRRAFAGDDITETLAAVVRDAPDLGAAPPHCGACSDGVWKRIRRRGSATLATCGISSRSRPPPQRARAEHRDCHGWSRRPPYWPPWRLPSTTLRKALCRRPVQCGSRCPGPVTPPTPPIRGARAPFSCRPTAGIC